MRLFDRVTHVAATPAAAALVAMFVASAPAGAQTTIELPAENATARAGKWVVTSDATAPGGGKTMRHPDAGAAKLTTALASPANYFELTFSRPGRRPYHLSLTARRTATTGATIPSSFSSAAASTPRVRRSGASVRPRRPRSISRIAAAAVCRAGNGRTTAMGLNVTRPNRSTSQPPAPRRCGCRRAKTGSRSIRSFSPSRAPPSVVQPAVDGSDRSRCSTGIPTTASAPMASTTSSASSPTGS